MTDRAYSPFDISVKTGILHSVDYDNDICDVQVEDGTEHTGIPIHYHCDDTEEDDGGSTPFHIGDRVFCLFEKKVMKEVFGFADGIRQECKQEKFFVSSDTSGWNKFSLLYAASNGTLQSVEMTLKYAYKTSQYTTCYVTFDQEYPNILYTLSMTSGYLLYVTVYKVYLVLDEESGLRVLATEEIDDYTIDCSDYEDFLVSGGFPVFENFSLKEFVYYHPLTDRTDRVTYYDSQSGDLTVSVRSYQYQELELFRREVEASNASSRTHYYVFEGSRMWPEWRSNGTEQYTQKNIYSTPRFFIFSVGKDVVEGMLQTSAVENHDVSWIENSLTEDYDNNTGVWTPRTPYSRTRTWYLQEKGYTPVSIGNGLLFASHIAYKELYSGSFLDKNQGSSTKNELVSCNISSSDEYDDITVTYDNPSYVEVHKNLAQYLQFGVLWESSENAFYFDLPIGGLTPYNENDCSATSFVMSALSANDAVILVNGNKYSKSLDSMFRFHSTNKLSFISGVSITYVDNIVWVRVYTLNFTLYTDSGVDSNGHNYTRVYLSPETHYSYTGMFVEDEKVTNVNFSIDRYLDFSVVPDPIKSGAVWTGYSTSSGSSSLIESNIPFYDPNYKQSLIRPVFMFSYGKPSELFEWGDA